MSITPRRRAPHALAGMVVAASLCSQACRAVGSQPTQVDLIVINAHVVTMNDRRDVIGQLGYVAKLHKLDWHDRNVMPAIDVVDMATRGGARALHMEDRIGSLEPGKLADLIVLDGDATAMVPLYDVYSALVYAASPKDVRSTIVHGRIVMEDRKVTTVDVNEVKAKMREIARRVNAAVAKGIG